MTTPIRTSHAGSLPRTPALIAANRARLDTSVGTIAETEDAAAPTDATGEETAGDFDSLLTESVVDILQRQKDLGITEPNDGEYGHAMAAEFDYGAWWHYVFARTGGLEINDKGLWELPEQLSEPGKIRLNSFAGRRDRALFPGAYSDPHAGTDTGHQPGFPVATGPISYTGTEQVQRDIRNALAGAEAAGYDTSRVYLNALSPASGARIENRHYDSYEEFVWAWADVLREEYLAITEAGLTLQIDDPSLAENWDQIAPEPTFEDYRNFTQLSVDALNHALRGIDPQQVRVHTCWGSWHGPHVTDLPFREIVETVLGIEAAGITFEAANVRHEHEWRIWEDVKLPEGKYIVPGVVSHATNVVEHPELVADRIERFGRLVGPENVVASTDCGLGGRVHPEIAVAKLQSLTQGAELAAKRF
ncbi:cobalamin-independent methionine synthase II family protein [Brevibacterium litoralis]|uniref:cobalamin-independent methionine synthase II family protein n=1 Tax=Brevibacterium litoralis TaxID=3138935 RepID=UPI0032EBFE65